MAKNKMQLKYKSKKRERNKKVVEVTPKDSALSFVKTLVGVLVFIGIMYLMLLGLKALGMFEAGYTKPTKDATTISYEYIPASTVFTRYDKEYYVLFDDYTSSNTKDPYVNDLIDNDKEHVYYRVNIGSKENEKVKGEKANPEAKSADELSIDGLTLIRISNGKISKYLTGNEKIEEFLKK